MKLFRDEAGQTLVFTAFLMCCLFGFMALALDMGVLFRAHRRIQTAADAGAVAAGLTAEYGQSVTCSGATPAGSASTSVKCAAGNAAAANGVDGSQLTVNQPPNAGYHVGAEYIEVIVRQPNPTVFMGAFSGTQLGGGNSNFKTMTVASRAVSGIVPGQSCMFALDPHADDAFDVQGSGIINTPNCSIQINSDSDQALCTTGGKATIDSIAINIVGAQNPKGKCNKGQSNATTGVAPANDPFAGLPAPTCDGTNTFAGTNITGPTTISGTTFSLKNETFGSGATTTAKVVCFSGSNVTIANGVTLGAAGGNSVFVFQNGVKIGGTVTINGTLYDAGGKLDQSNFALTIKAPSDETATYNGLALVVPATNTTNTCGGSYSSFGGTPAPGGCIQIQFGSSFGDLDGMIYAPASAVYMQDNGGGSVVTAIIADELYDKSSNLEITNNYNFVHSTSPLNHVALVE